MEVVGFRKLHPLYFHVTVNLIIIYNLTLFNYNTNLRTLSTDTASVFGAELRCTLFPTAQALHRGGKSYHS